MANNNVLLGRNITGNIVTPPKDSMTTGNTAGRGTSQPMLQGQNAGGLPSLGLGNGDRSAGTTPAVSPYQQAMTSNWWNYMQTNKANEEATNQYLAMLQQGQDQANSALDAARADDLAKIKAIYDDSARNYYRLYKSQKNELPEQLSSIGATGGASESAALRLMGAYSDNLYKNENARNNDIYDANSGYNQQIAANSQQYAAQLADAYYNLAQQELAAKSQYQQQAQQIKADQAAYKQEQQAAAAQAEIDNWNARVNANIAFRKSQGYKPATWYDAQGKIHYTIAGQSLDSKKKSSVSTSKGSGSKGSGTGGSGSGSGGETVDKPEKKATLSKDFVKKSQAIGVGLYPSYSPTASKMKKK